MKKGWICPKCNTIYSPYVDLCINCKFISTESLTNTQKKYLNEYIKFFTANNRYPTYTEFSKIMGTYQSVCFSIIKKIKEKGYLL